MGAAMPEPQSLSHALDAECSSGSPTRWFRSRHHAAAAPARLARLSRTVPFAGHHREQSGARSHLAKRVIDATGMRHRARAARRCTNRQEDMMACPSCLHERRQQEEFIDAVKADPQTYADWSGNGEWDYEPRARRTSCSRPSCANRSNRRSPRRHPTESEYDRRHLGTVTDQGDLTYSIWCMCRKSTAPTG